MAFRLAFPIRRNPDGTLAVVEQGTAPDLTGQIHALVLTDPGHFTRQPDLGLYDQAHLEAGADLGEIQRQIDTYVPDAQTAVEEDPAALNDALSLVNVTVGAV